MHRNPDPVTEFDLAAYVDEQLGAARRIEVEGYLAERPAQAAAIMADLRSRDELRLALSGLPLAESMRTTALAVRLERTLRRRVVRRQVSRAAVLALMLGAGWFAHSGYLSFGVRESAASAPPPPLVADAIRAHGTSAIRAAMVSQIETAAYDRGEILAATAIRIPELPASWTVLDVQVYPSTLGPSVGMALGSPELGDVSLFAARPGTIEHVPVEAYVVGNATAALWQVGEVAYALVAIGGSRETLEGEAVRISQELR